MIDLAEFLLARIAEDEELAREADRIYVHPGAYDPMFGARRDDEIASRYWDQIADPARVLAECEAKRRVRSMQIADEVDRILAAVYAGHPDYREEWRP